MSAVKGAEKKKQMGDLKRSKYAIGNYCGKFVRLYYKTYAKDSLPKSTSARRIKALTGEVSFLLTCGIPKFSLRGRAKPRRDPLVLYTKKVTVEAAAASRSHIFY